MYRQQRSKYTDSTGWKTQKLWGFAEMKPIFWNCKDSHERMLFMKVISNDEPIQLKVEGMLILSPQ